MSEALKLWFFRDLSDEQRLKLFALFGLPVDEIGKLHGRQAIALRHITLKLVELVRDKTAPPPPENHVIGLESRQGDWMQTVTGRQFWLTDKLLPCPFCGEEPYFSQPVVGSEYFEVSCSTDDCGAMGQMFKSKSEAAAMWNRRTPAPQTTEEGR